MREAPREKRLRQHRLGAHVAVKVAGQLRAALSCSGFHYRERGGYEPVPHISQPAKTLSRPQPAGEVIDVTTQVVRKERKHFSRIQHFARRCTRLRCCLADASDVSRDLRGTL